MSKKVKCGLLQCVYVGVVVAIMEALYLVCPVNPDKLWLIFIPLAICFLTGASSAKSFVILTLNCWFGIFCGWVIYQLIFAMMGGGMSMIPAFVIGTVIIVFIAQYLTMTVFGESGYGVCPMAFIGMVICFASGGTELVYGAGWAAFGVLCGVIMVVLCGVAAKQAGLAEEPEKHE